jgi:hypothetical protein
MKTNRKPGTRPANPEQPITLTLGFAASEAFASSLNGSPF